MSHTEIRNKRLSSIGSFVVTALFCISVPHQDVTIELSIKKFTLSSDTTQLCGPDLLPVSKPLAMDSHYWTVTVYRDSVPPRSRHFGNPTGLLYISGGQTLTSHRVLPVPITQMSRQDCDTGSGSHDLSFWYSLQDSSILIYHCPWNMLKVPPTGTSPKPRSRFASLAISETAGLTVP